MLKKEKNKTNNSHQSSRMPENSTFFEKVVPALLILMAIFTVGLILFALGVLIGLVSF